MGILFGRDFSQGISIVEQKQNRSRLIQSCWLCCFKWMLDPLVFFSHHDLLGLESNVALCASCTCDGSGIKHACTFSCVYQCLRFLLCTLRSQSKFCYFYLNSQTYLRYISILQHGYDAGWPLLKGLCALLCWLLLPSMSLQECLSDPESKNSRIQFVVILVLAFCQF